jgi:hypothetical protein
MSSLLYGQRKITDVIVWDTAEKYFLSLSIKKTSSVSFAWNFVLTSRSESVNSYIDAGAGANLADVYDHVNDTSLLEKQQYSSNTRGQI